MMLIHPGGAAASHGQQSPPRVLHSGERKDAHELLSQLQQVLVAARRADKAQPHRKAVNRGDRQVDLRGKGPPALEWLVSRHELRLQAETSEHSKNTTPSWRNRPEGSPTVPRCTSER